MTEHDKGLARGVAMTDDECIRFVNGIVAALLPSKRPVSMQPNAYGARLAMPSMIDALAAQGMIATVGYNGCAVIAELKGQPA